MKDEASWLKLFGGLLLSLCVGGISSFGSLSSSFQRMSGSTAGQVAAVGLAGDCGLFFSYLPGFAMDRLGRRFGFIVGSLLVAFGFGSTILALALRANYLFLVATWFLVGHGFAWLFCTNLLSNVTSWKHEARGYAVGALQSFFGMSGPFFIAVYENIVFDSKKLVPFLIFMASLTLLAVAHASYCGGGLMLTTTEEGRLDKDATRRFQRICVYVVLVLLLIVSTSLAEQTLWNSYLILAVFLFGLYPVIFFGETTTSRVVVVEDRNTTREPFIIFDDDDEDEEGDDFFPRGEEEDNFVVGKGEEDSEEPLACLGPLRVEFWELFLTFGVLVGGALSTSNSMSSITMSLPTCQYGKLSSAALTLSTASDAFGRLISGVLINTNVCDGSVVLAAGALALGAAHTAYSAAHAVTGPYSSGDGFLFLVASSLNGFADGTAWTACPWLCADRFGTKRYGDNFGLATLSAIFSFVMIVLVVLPVGQTDNYDEEKMLRRCHDSSPIYEDDDRQQACYGGKCFFYFHRTIQAASVLALICALDMERRRRNRNNNRQQKQQKAGKEKQQKAPNNGFYTSPPTMPTITEEKEEDERPSSIITVVDPPSSSRGHQQQHHLRSRGKEEGEKKTKELG